MEKKTYSAPLLREIPVLMETSFLASGSGEDATPGDGFWDDEDGLN